MWHISITCTFYYNLHFGYNICQVMIVKNNDPVMISKLQLACNPHYAQLQFYIY